MRESQGNLGNETVVVVTFISHIAVIDNGLGSRLKGGLSKYGDFRYKDKTVVNLYTGKTASFYWDAPLLSQPYIF